MLEIAGVTLAYGDTVVVSDLTLQAADGEVLCVLGPSGCGKSTLLRGIAGLEPLQAGTVHLDGTTLSGLRPDERGVGLMFQEHALFPHRSVADNVAFGPRMRGSDPAEIDQRVRETLDLVGLTGTGDRKVDELSGGERQRVALARAIAPRPRLLMLDEPLGSLDRALQTRLLADLPEVFAELGTTVVYVTHDQDEALSLADRVAVMRAGRIVQQGGPSELWHGPSTPFVARFLGLEHLIEVEVHAATVSTPWRELDRSVVTDAGAGPGPGLAVLLADALRLASRSAPTLPHELTLTGEVMSRRFLGDHVRVRVHTADGRMLAVPVWRGAVPELGDEVELALDPGRIHLLAPDPDRSE
ncbi:MAG: ABC transporter ATP-binding protein [Nitriliruptoraceae bacterium]